nr:universal stress protein [Dissulfurirhabdus thermomarina]
MSGQTLILVPVDFSECAGSALRYAAGEAARWEGDLVLLHVVDRRLAEDIAGYTGEPVEKVKDRMAGRARKAFKEFVARWGGGDRVRESLVAFGLPFQEIAVKARELQVDLVVMGGYGSRGHGQIEEIFFGSTVERVVRLLPCPVLCVPMG